MTRILLSVVFLAFCTSRAVAQATLDHPVGEVVGYHFDSGTLDNPTDKPRAVLSRVIDIGRADWIRLFFKQASLTGGSYIEVTSIQNGDLQRLDADALKTWSNSTAYFNGHAVILDLVATPGSRGNRLVIEQLTAQFPVAPRGEPGQCGICGSDGRTRSSDDFTGRLMPVGCTASIFCEGSTMVSAGHCINGSGLVVQFRVPDSLANCDTVNPPVADQFPVTATQSVDGGVGNDWSVLSVGNNNLGQQPFQRYGELRRIAASVANVGDPVNILGYGVDLTCFRSQTQQLSTGSVTGVFSNTYQFNADIRGGNSGSALLTNDEIVGIVTHCQVGCPNLATRSDLPAFMAARNAMSNCQVQPCPANWDNNCTLDSRDFFAFLSSFFSGSADFNRDGVTNSQDFFDFLAGFFNGCALCRDIGVANVSGPAFVTPGCTFDATFSLNNHGSCPLDGPIAIGAWLSLDQICCAGPDNAPLGLRTINLNPPLVPGQSRSFTLHDLSVPTSVALGPQNLFIVADPADAVPECSDAPNAAHISMSVQWSDVSVGNITVAGTRISGQPLTVAFDITNPSTCSIVVSPAVSLCGPVQCVLNNITLPQLSTIRRECTFNAPPSQFDCGQPDVCTGAVCVPVALDPNPANNCRGYEVALVDPYFDLRLEVIPPSQGDFCACPPTPRTYRVRVWNDGNAAYVPGSAPAQFQTALCRDPGCDDYDTPALPGGVQIRLINQTIEPHQSATYIISYPICGALCNRNQYLKAKINFGDLCTTGNCDEVAVPVVCSPCN